MQKVLRNKKYLLLFVLLAVVTVTTVAKLSKSKLFTSLRKDKYDYTEVQEDDNKIEGTEFVTFDTYFLKDTNNDGEAEKYRGSKIEYGESDKLYFDLNVSGDVKLINGKITFVNKNVKIGGVLSKNNVIPSNLSNTDYRTIQLSDEINPGTTSFFYLNVTPNITNDLNKFSDTNKVILEATVVDNTTGVETPVRKEISYDIDIEAKKISTSINRTNSSNSYGYADITYEVEMQENNDSMPLKAAHLTGSISDFEGFHPSSVEVRSADGVPIDFEYNSENQTFTAVKNAVLEDNIITRNAYNTKNGSIRYNKWIISVKYDTPDNLVADNKSASINVKGWYTGYTDINLTEKKSNEVNKIVSHVFTVRPTALEHTFSDNSKIEIGNYSNTIQNYFVDKSYLENAYLGLNTGMFNFIETWDLSSKPTRSDVIFYEEQGDYLGSEQSIKDFTTYKTARLITNPNLNNYSISIIDADTNEVLFVIDKNNKNNTFDFPANVRKIKILTNKVPASFYYEAKIQFVKSIDSISLINNISINDFARYGTISNTAYAYTYDENGETIGALPINGNAAFSEGYSNATINTFKTSYAREISDTAIPMSYTIKHNSIDAATKVWKEGFYLIKLPNGIIDIDNLEVTSTSTIVSSEKTEILGDRFIKIIVSNYSNSNGDIYVNFDAIVNPKEIDCSGDVELYAINNTDTLYNNSVNDIYDLNENGMTSDKASYSKVHITVAAPNELLTGAIIKDYDDKGSETVSPLIADVNPVEDDSDANVDVFIINNSNFKIKNIELVGKLAYQGNTYEGITGDLGSQYDVTLTGPIELPNTLNGHVTIYYTTKETPTRDINDTNNGWTTEVSDYSTIKTYMIKMDDSVEMNVGDTYDFVFPVEIPNTTENLLKKTYFNHGVYFERVTDAGTVTGKVTAPKLGVRIARKYNLNLNVFKAFSNNKVPGGRYLLADDEGNKRIISLNSEGSKIVKDLYVDKEYTLVQYSAPTNYIIDRSARRFKIENKNDNSLELSYNGTYRKIEYNENNTLDVDLDMDILYSLDLHNIDADSNADISNTLFKVYGKNHESGTNVLTNSSGHAYLNNLELNLSYHVQQVKIDDYVKIEDFNFKLERDPETHNIKILVESLPTIEKSENCDPLYEQLMHYSNGLYEISTNKRYGSLSGIKNCNLTIDLSKYREKYTLQGSAYMLEYMNGPSYNPYIKLSLVKDLVNESAEPFITVQKPDGNDYYTSSNITKSFSTNKAYEKVQNNFNEVDLKGGSSYNLFISYNPTSYTYSNGRYTNGYITLSNMKLNNEYNRPEFIFQDETENVYVYNNTNVSQTIKNYLVEDINNPILEINVKNKYIQKATLEINKYDGETNELLAGAQYKITGPGLPVNGKYVTIGSNGKAVVDLYLSYTGLVSYVPGISDNYPKTNYYIIEEAVPPTGYSKDDKPVKFMLVADVNRDNSTGDLSYEYKLNYDLNTSDNKFSNYEIDNENRIWKVSLKDYPIIKIKKTDEETGEILPNTYYALYSVNRADGIETVDYAKDSEGNYIGEKLTIDGEDYYVVKTNENGNLTLNLSEGQYQLKEIQAADDKYEISDEIHYFGVGKTIPYQAAGINLVNGVEIKNLPINESSNNNVYPTSDGGYMAVVISGYNSPVHLMKYDSNLDLEWFKTYPMFNRFESFYTYFDDPDRESKYNEDRRIAYPNYSYFKETENYYYVSGLNNDVVKINKDDGSTVFETSIQSSTKFYNEFREYCDIPEGKTINDYPVYQRNPLYDDKYYCNSGNFKGYNYYSNYDWTSHVYVTDDDEIYVLSRVPSADYGFKLKDGTVVSPESSSFESLEPGTGNRFRLFLVKYDQNGDIVSANDLTEKYYDAKVEYLNSLTDNMEEEVANYASSHVSSGKFKELISYKIEKTMNQLPDRFSKLKVLKNGDIMFEVKDRSISYKYSYYPWSYSDGDYSDTPEEKIDKMFNIDVVIRMDKNLNTIYYSPIIPNDCSTGLQNNINGYTDSIFNEDGSFEYAIYGSCTVGKEQTASASSTFWDKANINSFNIEPEEAYKNTGYSSYGIFRWDSSGKPKDYVEYQRSSRNPNYYDTSNDMKRVYMYNNPKIAKVEDGYIIISPLTSRGTGGYNNDLSYRTVELASGETVTLSTNTNVIVYKVNEDSSVDWVKQYGNFDNSKQGGNIFEVNDGRFVLYTSNLGPTNALNFDPNANGKVITSVNDDKLPAIMGTGGATLVEFKLNDEVAPSAPEAYSLDLTNKRKKYDIKVTNNEGGTFEVKNKDGDVIYTGSEPGLVETVKHGDDTEKTIKVTPNRGYDIKKITVNGENAKYTVNNDGSVTLDGIKNVTEEKDINVTFERDISRVIVHHYLKDTTTPISSDELLTGRIDTDYETEAKVSALYNLAKDSNGEYIIPNNAKGNYALDPIEVTYYYEVNMVKLKVNFYKVDTEISLADSIENMYALGSRYLTEALGIEHYTVVGVVGNESGTLTSDLTEVTYFYDNAETAKIEVNYLDVETGLPVANKVTKVIPINTRYETEKLVTNPEGYDYLRSEGDVVGTITEPNSTVVVNYFYTRIKSTVTTRYLDPVTKKDITEKKIQVVNLGDEYETHELDNIPKGYKLIEIPSNYKGVATKRNIEVVYYYEKIKDVKDDVEVPDTSDDSLKYFIISFTSLVSLILVYKIKSKLS